MLLPFVLLLAEGEREDRHMALYDLFVALHNVVLHVWLIRIMCNAGTPPALDGILMRRMFLGWGVNQSIFGFRLLYWFTDPTDFVFGYSIDLFLPNFGMLVWTLGVGTCSITEQPGTYGVAFWAAAGLIGNRVMSCVQLWAQAVQDGTLT